MEELEYYTLSNGMSLTDPEDVKIFQKLLDLQPYKNINFLWNDIGLGNLFGECFKHLERFCVDDLRWYLYQDGIWVADKGDIKSQANMQKLLQLLVLYTKEVQSSVDEDHDDYTILEDYRKFINKSSSDAKLRQILNASKNSMIIEKPDFDVDPYLLNCKNGVYDLKNLTFRWVRPDDLFTRTTTCSFPTALNLHTCDRWYKFIDEITGGDKEKAQFLQRALGYTLLGINKEECMFLAYGKTRSGKGTLFNTIANILGTSETGYGGTISSTLLIYNKYKDKDFNAPEPMLADTVGVRYLTISETSKYDMLDEKNIKSLTGRDMRKTRALHQAPFTFTPQFTMWLSTNFLPRIVGDDLFKSSRIWVIEFNEHFDTDNRDMNLKEVFSTPENKSIILKWLIDGYIDYTLQGLNPPQCIIEATERYAKSNDSILCFKEDCLVDAPGEKVTNAVLYQAYKEWCEDDERDFTPIKSTSFYREMDRFYQRYYIQGYRGFKDCKLKESSDLKSVD